jgi:hypothetical protein
MYLQKPQAPGKNNVDVAVNALDRMQGRVPALVQKAGSALRTCSHSKDPAIKRRGTAKRRRRRRPPKASTFDFERRRQEKRSAGYQADTEESAAEDGTSTHDDAIPTAGMLSTAPTHRRAKEKHLKPNEQLQVDSSGASLFSGHHHNHTIADEGRREFVSRICSSNSQQVATDSVSIGTVSTMATTISESPRIPTYHLPFEVDATSTGPFTLSRNAVTMSQALDLSHHAHIIVDASSPFVVKHVNAAFCKILKTYGVSSGVLGEPLLRCQEQELQGAFGTDKGSLQTIMLEAKKIILFPIISEHDGRCHGWELHDVNCNRGTGTAFRSTTGIVNHFLIQILDANLESSAMQVIA